VNVQLIDARTDTHLWANTYDRDLKDVFGVESEIAQTIANALQARLSPAETNSLTNVPTQDPEAYDLFLKGEYAEQEAENVLKAEPFGRAAVFYQQALDRDANFVLAAARLVVSRVRRHFFIAQLSQAELSDLKNLADRTLALAPNLAEAHIALGSFYYYSKRQYEHALACFQRALQLQPNNVVALERLAYIYRRQGKWERALSEMANCEVRDPRNPQLVANIGGAYCSLRMWEEAKRAGSRALAIDPHSILGLQTVFLASLNGTGNIDEARRTLANYPPGARVADFTVLGSAPPSVYLKVIERDFATALKLSESEIADPDENRAASDARSHSRVGGQYRDGTR
jgi:tetratricopeptide (TPR) repeat protein